MQFKSLCLSGELLGDETAFVLATGMSNYWTTLKRLSFYGGKGSDFCYRGITDKGASAILKTTPPTLKSLRLGRNLTTDSVETLILHLPRLRKLRIIDMRGRNIDVTPLISFINESRWHKGLGALDKSYFHSDDTFSYVYKNELLRDARQNLQRRMKIQRSWAIVKSAVAFLVLLKRYSVPM